MKKGDEKIPILYPLWGSNNFPRGFILIAFVKIRPVKEGR